MKACQGLSRSVPLWVSLTGILNNKAGQPWAPSRLCKFCGGNHKRCKCCWRMPSSWTTAKSSLLFNSAYFPEFLQNERFSVTLKCAKMVHFREEIIQHLKPRFLITFSRAGWRTERKKSWKIYWVAVLFPLPSTLPWLGCLSALPNGEQLSVKINLQQIVSIQKVEAILQSFMRITVGGSVDPKTKAGSHKCGWSLKTKSRDLLWVVSRLNHFEWLNKNHSLDYKHLAVAFLVHKCVFISCFFAL